MYLRPEMLVTALKLFAIKRRAMPAPMSPIDRMPTVARGAIAQCEVSSSRVSTLALARSIAQWADTVSTKKCTRYDFVSDCVSTRV